ncbi:MAG: LysR family transcriptional regulator [Lachnospirales bacterium]
MNLQHLKYAIEVANTSSINKAAENLYMNQPNLSRAIKELEENIGISIFNRTSKGISVTELGGEFLISAKNILRQVEEIESAYKSNGTPKQHFSISVPRASYISEAFVEFSKKIDRSKAIEFYYKETNAYRAINNILKSGYKLGIIRYRQIFDDQFRVWLKEKELTAELLYQFSCNVLISKDNELATKNEIDYKELEDFIEIAHADPYVPSIPLSKVKEEEFSDFIDKRIFVFERATQFSLLNSLSNSFMWVSPVSKEILDLYNLVEIPCKSTKHIYKDMIIKQKDYKLSDLDKLFLTELSKAKRHSK